MESRQESALPLTASVSYGRCSNPEGRTSQGLFAHSVQHFISLRSAQSYLRRFRHCEAYEHFLKFYEALLADGVLHPAGILFGLFRFDASAEKQLCEKAMPLVNSAGDGASCVRQEEIAPHANGYIALLLEPFHGDAHACPGNAHAPGQLRAVRFALFPFQQEQRLQVVLRRPARRGLPAHRMLPR